MPWSLVRAGSVVRLLDIDGVLTGVVTLIEPDDHGPTLIVDIAADQGGTRHLRVHPDSEVAVEAQFDAMPTPPDDSGSPLTVRAIIRRRNLERLVGP